MQYICGDSVTLFVHVWPKLHVHSGQTTTTSHCVVAALTVPCAPQTLSDWKGQDRDADRKLSCENRAAWKRRIADFFNRARASRPRGQAINLKQQKLANMFSLMALDGLMQGGMDDNLEAFRERSDHVVRFPLKDWEKRFWVDVNSLPPQMRIAARGRVKRACIGDARSETTHLECKVTGQRRALHLHADKGPCSRPAIVWAFCAKKLRGWYHWDPCHEKHNIHINSLRCENLSQARHEMALVASAGLGPWKSQAHFGKYSECMMEFVINGSLHDELFQHLYAAIVHDECRGVRPLAFGTLPHMQATFDGLNDPLVVDLAGELTQPGRWFRPTKRWRKVAPAASKLLLAIVRIGVISGWWATVEDSPLHADILASEGRPQQGQAPEPAPEPGEGGQDQVEDVVAWAPMAPVGRAVALSSKEVEKKNLTRRQR